MLSEEEKKQIEAEHKALVKITLENKDQVCSEFTVKRAKNNTGIVVGGSPLNLWENWTVLNFSTLFESTETAECYPVYENEAGSTVQSKYKVIKIEYLTENI